MKFYAAAAALIAAVEAVSLGNTDYDKIEAGKAYTIDWYSAAGPVSIELRYGKFDDLQSLETILSSYTGDGTTGTYVWQVPATLPQEGPYAFVISDDNGVNYSPQFPIAGVAVSESKPSDTVAPSTTKAPATTKSSATAALVPDQTSSSFEFQQTSSAPAISAPTAHSSSTFAKTTTSTTSKTSSAPSTVASPPDGEGKAPGMASPLALILVSVAAMFYLQ